MKKGSMVKRFIAALAVFVMCIVGAPFVAAQSTIIQAQIGPLPVDVCPNIAGLQAAVPSGMILDGNGDCVTPIPVQIDVCANIAGLQITIPSGYYQDSNGNCLVQTAPPVDVCPNIYGLQVVVPSSLIVDGNGYCVTPAVDECPNIDGNQAFIPLGMVFDHNECFTPPGTISPPNYQPPSNQPGTTTPSPSRPGAYTGPIYKNVPEALSPILDPIVKAIPEPVVEILKSVPAEVARSVPYYISGIVAGIASVLAIQAVRELFAAKALIVLLRREKNIADQKDNFIALASHYLRTPLTLMRNGLDTIVALKELPAESITQLRDVVMQLEVNIKSILADIENNDELSSIKMPSIETKKPHVLRSAFFWGPIVLSAFLTVSANFLLGVVANVELGTFNMIMQVIVLAAVMFLLYSAVRNAFLRRQQRHHQQVLVEHEHTVDEARNAFIQRSTSVLQRGLNDLYAARGTIETAPSSRFFSEGYTRFSDILQKFLLLSQIQTGTTHMSESVNLREVIDTAVLSLAPAAQEKNLTIKNDIDPSIFVQQNKGLFYFVIQSLVDNAIKFNNPNGEVSLTANPLHHTMRVSVTDNGIGIPKDKLPQLFKPFSRAGSAIEFDYEGLGFSLFLDKIITDYMGGTIKATAPDTGGTSITVTTDLAYAKD